jgi:hypothetical protein
MSMTTTITIAFAPYTWIRQISHPKGTSCTMRSMLSKARSASGT